MVAELWIVTEVTDSEVAGTRSSGDRGASFSVGSEKVTTKRTPVDVAALKVQMEGLLRVVGELFAVSSEQQGLRLDEVELSVEINAEGQVSLIGNGGKLGNRGAIKLKLKRMTEGS